MVDRAEQPGIQLVLRFPRILDCILQEGDGKATAWGCDLTYDYVKINADYRS